MISDKEEVIFDEDFEEFNTTLPLSSYDLEPREFMIFDIKHHYEDTYDSNSKLDLNFNHDFHPDPPPPLLELWNWINK